MSASPANGLEGGMETLHLTRRRSSRSSAGRNSEGKRQWSVSRSGFDESASGREASLGIAPGGSVGKRVEQNSDVRKLWGEGRAEGIWEWAVELQILEWPEVEVEVWRVEGWRGGGTLSGRAMAQEVHLRFTRKLLLHHLPTACKL